MALGSLSVLFAPDSFKGSLTSVEVARALAEGWSRPRPDDRPALAPLADGGEGTLEAIAVAGGWQWRTARVANPIGRAIDARWLCSAAGSAAWIELAAASGLSRLSTAQLDPGAASTIGTGQLVAAALDAGVRTIALGIGGSATTDGGRGLIEALGARIDDGRIELSGLDRRLGSVTLEVASDVTNPLLGEEGAAAVYGPQKGATPDIVELLDERLGTWADELERATGRRERDTPGAGAAGGVGFALLCLQDRFRSFALRPGVDLVMDATGFDAKLVEADLVMTGEGRIDAQTAFGKTALGVARRAQAAGVPCIAVGGGVEPEGIDALNGVGTIVVPVVERPLSVEAAMGAGVEPLVRCADRIAQLVGLGSTIRRR